MINPSSMKISVTTEGNFAVLDQAVQHNLLRIAQESMTNAIKHSNATRVDVALNEKNGGVELVVSDNGIGFDPESPAIRNHFGLRGLHARARRIKAALTVRSAPGAGTTISVTWLPNPPPPQI